MSHILNDFIPFLEKLKTFCASTAMKLTIIGDTSLAWGDSVLQLPATIPVPQYDNRVRLSRPCCIFRYWFPIARVFCALCVRRRARSAAVDADRWGFPLLQTSVTFLVISTFYGFILGMAISL